MSNVQTIKPDPGSNLSGVKNLVVVASGKGGVGKSTTAVNLALALAKKGYSTGLFDADIYGPSQPLMLGIAPGTRPEVVDQKFMLPIEVYDIKCNSVGLLVDENQAMAWRGPMMVGAFNQILNDTRWGDLDFLVVDMPPGTGDIQLSLAQSVPVSGAVIVTTPQDVALLDAKRGIELFRKVEIPILGVVENMSIHICSNCGHSEHIFGDGGASRIAENYQVELLGELPLDANIRQQCDVGAPSVVAEPDGIVAGIYLAIACRVAEQLAEAKPADGMPNITISDD